MFVSQDHFLIQCKAVAQATFIFAFSNFECSIQQYLEKKKGTFVQSKCGPGLGGFLGDVWCFSERNEVLWESEHFPTIIVLAAIAAPLPQPKQGCGWQILLSPEVHHDREQSWALKRCSSPLQRHGAGLNHQAEVVVWALGWFPAASTPTQHRQDGGKWDMLLAITALC